MIFFILILIFVALRRLTIFGDVTVRRIFTPQTLINFTFFTLLKTIITSLVIAGSFPLIHAQDALNDGFLDPLVVSSSSGDQLDSLEKSRQRLESLPGGAHIIDSENWTGRASEIEEIFKLDPGVYARSAATSHDDRLSIRGSGIQRRYGSRGLSLLINDMPANQADGAYQFRLVDPLTINHIETFRGANGLPFGAYQLGGAINVVQKNGLTDPGSLFVAEYGSHDSYRTGFQHAGSNERWDWFAAYTYGETGGYRPHSARETHYFSSSLGYRWSDTAQTRFYLLFNDNDELLSGSLKRSQFDENFKGRVNVGDVNYDLSTIRFGQRTAWETENGGKWEFSTNYQYVDFYHLNTLAGSIAPNFPAFDGLVDEDNDEFSLNFRGSQDFHFLGLDHTFRTSFSYIYGVSEVGGSSAFGNAGLVDRKETAKNLFLYFENASSLTTQDQLIYGLGFVDSTRKREILGGDSTGTSAFDKSDSGFTWRAGYLRELGGENQFFANVSRSFESTPFSEASSETVVDPQSALTYEIGTRFAPNKWLSGELTLYHSKVRDEFIFNETEPNSGVFEVTNADTTHRGIEAAAHLNLTEAFGFPSQVIYRFDLAYQLNDFTFDEGSAKGNAMPVISKNVINSQISAAAADGKWRAHLSADWLPDGLVADNNHTFHAPGYALWNFSGEYRVSETVSIYGGINNLFDKKYATSVLVNPSGDDPSYLFPGDGRNAYLGAKIRF